MTNQPTAAARRPFIIERSYEAPLNDLWELWTTKDGFESWWGPQGFRVEVLALDARVGGELHYDMIAAGENEIAYMKSAGMPLSHAVKGTFSEFVPQQRLKLTQMIDFIQGVDAYAHDMLVEFIQEGATVRMVITTDPHVNDEWSQNAKAGMESQLTKVPAVLAARAKR